MLLRSGLELYPNAAGATTRTARAATSPPSHLAFLFTTFSFRALFDLWPPGPKTPSGVEGATRRLPRPLERIQEDHRSPKDRCGHPRPRHQGGRKLVRAVRDSGLAAARGGR